MALKSGRVGVNPDQVDLHGRIKNITPPDLSDYVKKTDAPGYNDILTETEASTVYQPKLVSGTNIKTINNNSLLGSGDLSIEPKVAIDVNNVIATYSSWIPVATPYTATEDCYVVVSYTVYNVHLEVDGVTIFQSNANASTTGCFSAFVKKGQTVALYQTGNHSGTSGSAVIYGVK